MYKAFVHYHSGLYIFAFSTEQFKFNFPVPCNVELNLCIKPNYYQSFKQKSKYFEVLIFSAFQIASYFCYHLLSIHQLSYHVDMEVQHKTQQVVYFFVRTWEFSKLVNSKSQTVVKGQISHRVGQLKCLLFSLVPRYLCEDEPSFFLNEEIDS